jgi:hypothetical protein
MKSKKPRETRASSGKNSGIDRRHYNKGRIENLKTWQPGQSGNPRGRPKSHDELRELIRDLSAVTDSNGRQRLEQMIIRMFLADDGC